ncbi:MAG: PAS domain S-box protein, partial [Gaiellaceae bacterium]
MRKAVLSLVRQRPLGLLAHRREPHRLVFLLGAAAVCLFTSLDADSTVRALVYVGAAMSAAAVLVVSAAFVPARVRSAWALIAASQVFWAVGDGVWTAIDFAGGTVDPSAADVLYVLGYPVLAAGLGMLLRSDNRGFGWGEIVDGTIIALAFGLLLWPVVFQPAFVEGLSAATVTGLAYSTGDVLLLGLLAALFFQGGRRPVPVSFLAGSLLLVFVADVVYYVPTLGSSPSVQAWSDTVWLAAYVLVAAAATHPAARTAREDVQADEGSSLRPLRFVGAALLTMPAAFAAHQLIGSGEYDWRAFIAIDSIVAVLVVLRLSILLRQVDRARREASTARNQFETVFESAGLGITITKDDQLIRTNPAFQRLVGFTDGELGWMRRAEIVHPEDLTRHPEPSAATGAPRTTFGRRFVRRDGDVVFTDMTVTRSPTTGLEIGVVADVT